MKGFKLILGGVVMAILGGMYVPSADAGIFFGNGKAANRIQFRQNLRSQRLQQNHRNQPLNLNIRIR